MAAGKADAPALADGIAFQTGVLAQDPRPSYQDDPERVYGMAFGGLEVKFKVCEKTLAVVSVEKSSL